VINFCKDTLENKQVEAKNIRKKKRQDEKD
jgi:hypothetical protein